MELQNLYLWLNLIAVAVPLLLSFDGKVRFYRNWIYLMPAIILVGIPFIAWDVYFTQTGIWGFNERYLTGIEYFGLPLSEILFFITVPYSCVFIYACLDAYFGHRIRKMNVRPVLWLILALSIMMNIVHPGNPYTLSATILAALTAAFLLYTKAEYGQLLVTAFLVSMIPFLIMNGILTGSWIPEQIVWYNEQTFSGWRVLTIPVEDMFYSFSLISLNIMLMEFLKTRTAARKAGQQIESLAIGSNG